jgi:hypothetical protein
MPEQPANKDSLPPSMMVNGKPLSPAQLENQAMQIWANQRRQASRLLAEHLAASGYGALDGGYSGSYVQLVDLPGNEPAVLLAEFVAGRCMAVAILDKEALSSVLSLWSQAAGAPPPAPASTLWKPGDES